MLPWLGRMVSHPRQVWLITLTHAINEFYSVALPPIIPLIVSDLEISYTQAGGLLTVFYAMYSLFQLPAGRLADRVGQKHLLTLGMVGLAAGILIASVARDYPTLVAAQVVAGIGGSTYHPSGMSLISDLESGETEGKAMGIHGFGGVAGMVAAPAIIGGLAVLYDWRIAIAVSALVGLAYARIFATLFVVPNGNSVDDSDDLIEDIWDQSRGAESGLARRLTTALGRVTNVPLTWWYGGLCLIQFLLAFELSTIRTFAPTYLFERTGGSTGLANLIYLLMLVGGGGSTLVGGFLADRVDRRLQGFVALLLSAVGLAAVPIVPADGAVLFGWFFLLGASVFAASPAKNALASAYSERGFSGSVYGIMMTAGAVGSASGSLVFGIVAETLGVRAAFPLIAVVGVLGATTFALLFRI